MAEEEAQAGIWSFFCQSSFQNLIDLLLNVDGWHVSHVWGMFGTSLGNVGHMFASSCGQGQIFERHTASSEAAAGGLEDAAPRDANGFCGLTWRLWKACVLEGVQVAQHSPYMYSP